MTSSDSKGSSDTTTPVQKEKGKSLDMFSVLAGFSNKQIGEYFKQPYQTNTHHASDENLDKCRFQGKKFRGKQIFCLGKFENFGMGAARAQFALIKKLFSLNFFRNFFKNFFSILFFENFRCSLS